ncbi:hypothetical protein EUGRSUZ_B02255 [Eucalyptus grandis]|uniref:Uncharacterized protein n=2 Tax=Eucalyptus grandis TaxID=71139 RepID=A0ACC3LU80_EUCGR|nr:hypothetical protein EUGRSUZ_B02255 [Eucalyptus grandis]
MGRPYKAGPTDIRQGRGNGRGRDPSRRNGNEANPNPNATESRGAEETERGDDKQPGSSCKTSIMAEKLAPEKRHVFSHNGQTVFEWDQTLEEVNIYIKLPPNVRPKQFYCKIQSKHVELGIKDNPPYLNHDLMSPVKTDCSFWTLEEGQRSNMAFSNTRPGSARPIRV